MRTVVPSRPPTEPSARASKVTSSTSAKWAPPSTTSMTSPGPSATAPSVTVLVVPSARATSAAPSTRTRASPGPGPTSPIRGSRAKAATRTTAAGTIHSRRTCRTPSPASARPADRRRPHADGAPVAQAEVDGDGHGPAGSGGAARSAGALGEEEGVTTGTRIETDASPPEGA